MENYTFIILIALLLVFYFFRKYFFKESVPETASGAIVMAIGIFGNGAAYRFSLLDPLGPLLSIGLFLVWAFIAVAFVKLAIRKQLKSEHLTHPIQTFAVGTWVAGTAVCAVILAKRIPSWEWIAHGMAVIVVSLWVYYVILCIQNFRAIWKLDLYRKVHGVILLSTVSTQSMVILMFTLYNNMIPDWIYRVTIIIGIVFYMLGFYLIIKRYIHNRSWKLADDWPNPNCILHGAMSITGLACAVTGVIHPNITLLIWFWAILWFVIIECVEIWRAIVRISNYGWMKGIGIYHVTQWSRNFTFGMLYAFTYFFDLKLASWLDWRLLDTLHYVVLDYGAWLILFVLLYQCLLFMKEKVDLSMFIKERQRGH